MQKIEKHIPITEPILAIDALVAATDLSKSNLKQTMQKGAVWVTHKKHVQRLRRIKKQLQVGDELHLYYNEQVLGEVPPTPQLVADEEAYSIWFKPYGMYSQGSKWGDHCTITRWAEQHLQPERSAFLVHRLDRAASGLIIVAHQKKTAAAFGEMFCQREIEKQYQVIVHGQFPNDELDTVYDKPLDNKSAKTRARLLEYNQQKNISLLDIEIETGRKHQIRRHLSESGYPVVGDRLYGTQSSDHHDLQLTAYSLKFICPVNGAQKQYRLDQNSLPKIDLI